MKMTFTFTYDYYLLQLLILEDWGSNMSNVTNKKNLPEKNKKNNSLFCFVPFLTRQILDLFRPGLRGGQICP